MKKLYKELNNILPQYIMINFNNVYNLKEDIIHNVFIKIVEKGQYDSNKGMKSTYYTNICKNYIIDLYRKNKSMLKRNYEYIIKQDKTTETEIEPEKTIEQYFHNTIKEQFTRVEQFIITESYLNNKNNKEIKRLLQIDDKKLKRYKKRILNKMKQVFKDNKDIQNFIKFK